MTEDRTHPTPLAGIRVIEFCHMVMGPTVGMILGDLGAEVIKVEPIEGDRTRRYRGPAMGFHHTYNRNKKSLAIDLKSPEAMAVVRALIATGDVVIENFRPGAMAKLGLGPDDIRELNPRAIYCSLKGFLPGPYDHRMALDEVVQMMAGLAYMTGPAGRPLRAGASVNDIMGGMFGVIGILAALREREVTGRGREVQSALYETCAVLMASHVAYFELTGRALPPFAEPRDMPWPIYELFDTASGGQIFVTVVSEEHFDALCSEFALEELRADPDLQTQEGRIQHRDKLRAAITAICSTGDRDELATRMERAGLPIAPVGRPEELVDDPHLAASGGLFAIAHEREDRPLRLPGLPISLDGQRTGLHLQPPRVGEHSRAVLAGLGYDPAQIDDLIVRGIVAD